MSRRSLTNPGSQTSTVGQSATLQLQGSDANSDALTYAASGLPAGLQLDSEHAARSLERRRRQAPTA